MYAGTVFLVRPEDEVWRMTPRKFNALLKVHFDILKAKAGKTSAPAEGNFIDNISGW